MQYVIAITGDVYGKQSSFLAWQFACALLAKGHQIRQIFFMQNGVSHANKLISPAHDEENLLQRWQTFSETHQVPLHLCIAAAQRRGVVDALTSPCQTENLASPFVLAGLGEFSQAILKADRLIQF